MGPPVLSEPPILLEPPKPLEHPRSLEHPESPEYPEHPEHPESPEKPEPQEKSENPPRASLTLNPKSSRVFPLRCIMYHVSFTVIALFSQPLPKNSAKTEHLGLKTWFFCIFAIGFSLL